MRDVILVDDDVPVLDFLKAAVPWSNLGLRLTGTFENGLKAYDFAVNEQMPDIVVTDIGMPQMDGLQLIDKLKQLKQGLGVIILSCHDEFKYAQQAIKLGVDDYVLKETVEPHTIGEMLERVVKRLEEREAAEGAGAQPNAPQSDRHRSAAKELYIRELLYHPIASPEARFREAEQFGLLLGSIPYVPVLLIIDRYNETKARFVSEDNCSFALDNVTDELLTHYGSTAVSFRLSNRELLLLFEIDNSAGQHQSRYSRVESALRKIREALHKYLSMSVSFIVGEPAADLSKLRSEMLQLAEGRGQRFYLPEGTTDRLQELEYSQDDLFNHYAEALEQFREVVLLQESARIDPVVRGWAERIRVHRYSPETVKEWFLKLMLDLHLKFKTMEHVSAEYSREALHQTFLEADRLDRLAAIASDYMRKAIIRMEHVYGQPKRAEIAEAQRYVELNLGRKISLDEVASHLHLNSSYFSRLYRKETGETFIDFVTRMKMEKAKELLDQSRHSVHEIADRLGYDNKSYFVKLFKAHSGMTPGEYAGKEKKGQ